MEHSGRKVIVLSYIIRRIIGNLTEEAGVSGPQSRLLHFIADHSLNKDVYQRDVENEFHIRRSSVTNLVQQLERNGLIQRVSVDSDARLKKLILTEKGRQIENEIGERISQFEEQLGMLLGEDQKRFSDLLDILIEQLSN